MLRYSDHMIGSSYSRLDHPPNHGTTLPVPEVRELRHHVIAAGVDKLAIELAHALEEGIVASPEEADVALLYGVGFPSFRGGLARWMDFIGLDALCRTADRYASELGPLYRVTDRQRDMAAHVRTFYS
jgi:3-hydroxyacyl-CoA dehydrogenase/enoyl-CoA hydratase/3-hydroxybutyryl-CoA epimerase/enoyl-CoA isomerase